MWDELGMSRGYSMKELTRSRGYYVISERQGLYSFLAALRLDQPTFWWDWTAATGMSDSTPIRTRIECRSYCLFHS